MKRTFILLTLLASFFLADAQRKYWENATWLNFSGDILFTGKVSLPKDSISMKVVRTNKILPDTSNESDFEIVVIPDPQYMTQSYPGVLKTIFTWIVDSADDYNVKAAIGVGDMTQLAQLYEWQRIDSNYDRLDAANIPYITVPGNHDYAGGNPFGRNSTDYNTWFGDARHSGHSYYGGSFNGKAENNWIKLNIGSKKVMVLGFEFFPPDSVLTWAQNLLDSMKAAEPDREVWVTTHGYLAAFGELANDTTLANPGSYGLGADNDAAEMWEKLNN